jgi:hypothetical protein
MLYAQSMHDFVNYHGKCPETVFLYFYKLLRR